jgi:8-oxo-dGTP diphosphatase
MALMQASEQGTSARGVRHVVVPRTLIFVTSINPETGAREVLLLKGAPDKRLWANKYNGVGGHVEADEDVLAAARRELREEAGLQPEELTLRGVIHVDTGKDEQGSRPGVMVFVFRAQCAERTVRHTVEGAPEWIALDELEEYALVDDLYEVIPLALADGPNFFGLYQPTQDGTMSFRFVR